MSKNREPMISVRGLIRTLGDAEACRVFSVKPSALRNWIAVNELPEKHHLRAYKLCRERGIPFDPEAPAPDIAEVA